MKSVLLAAMAAIAGSAFGRATMADRPYPQIRRTPYRERDDPSKGKPGSKLARKAAQGKIGITHPR